MPTNNPMMPGYANRTSPSKTNVGGVALIGNNKNDPYTFSNNAGSSSSSSSSLLDLNIGSNSSNKTTLYDERTGYKNATSNITFNGTNGNDTLTNKGNNVIMNGGAGADDIYNYGGSNVTTYGGSGNDTLYNEGKYGVIVAGDGGSKLLINNGLNSTIYGGTNNDKIGNASSNVVMFAGAGNDTIYNWDGIYSTINAGVGDDIIDLYSSSYYRYGYNRRSSHSVIQYASGDGNDVIYSYSSDDTIQLLDNTTYNLSRNGNDVIINVGNGSITLKDYSLDISIAEANGKVYNYTRDYDDNNYYSYISNNTNNQILIGTNGVDSILNNGNSSTIISGAGDDIIHNGGNNVLISTGTGNDSIYNKGNYTTISAGSGNDTITNEGYSAIVIADSGNNKINNTGQNVTIASSNGNDNIENSGDYAVILSNGDNTITSNSLSSMVIAQSGNNVINVSDTANYSRANGSTVIAGSGNDTIWGDRLIVAGDGNDSIASSISDTTVNAGTGNDIIDFRLYGEKNVFFNVNANAYFDVELHYDPKHIKRNVIQYAMGDGDDTIYDFGRNDVIQIPYGTSYSTIASGNDVIVKFANGSLTLKDVNDGNFNSLIIDKSTIELELDDDNSNESSGLTRRTSTSRAVQIDNTPQINIVEISASEFANVKAATVQAKFGQEVVNVKVDSNINSNLSSGVGTINVPTTPTIINTPTETVEDTLAYNNDGDDTPIYNNDGDDTPIYNNDGDDTPTYNKDGDDTSTEPVVTKPITTTPTQMTNVKYNASKISVTLGTEFSGTFEDVKVKNINASKVVEDIAITGNAKNNVIIGGSGNNTLIGGAGNDNLTGGDGTNVFVYSEGKDVIENYNEYYDVIKIDSGNIKQTKINNKNVIFTLDTGKITVKNGKEKEITITDADDNTSSQVYTNALYINDDDKKTITAATSMILLDASRRNEDLKLNGNSKANTIVGGFGNDTIKTGGGQDVFIYSGGNDLITDYNATQDKIQLDEYRYDKVSVSGNNLIFETDSGNLTIKNAKTKLVTLIDSDGNERKYINETLIKTVTNKDKQSVKAANNIYKVDASSRSMSVKIIGNGKDNTIIGSTGSSTLTGGSGKDIFVHAGGRDLITDYTTSDKIQIGTYNEVSLKGSNVIFKTNKGEVTVKNGKGKLIALVDENGNDNIYADETITLTLDDESKNTMKAASKIYKIDASARTENIKLVGNGKANTIIGGTGDDTIQTGGGKDVFIHQSGNDVITDYTTSDTIYTNGSVDEIEINKRDAIIKVGDGSITVKNGASKKLNIIEDTWFTVDDNVVGDNITPIINVTEDVYSVGKIDTSNVLTKTLDNISYSKKTK